MQAEMKDSTSFGLGINTRSEGVETPFRVSGVTVPRGKYDWHEAEFTYNSNRSAQVSYGLRGLVGGYFGGTLREFGPSFRVRHGEQFSTSISLTRDDIDLPTGSVVTNLATWRMAYNFSPELYVQTLIQYNTSAKLWASNLRFGWVQTANTGLFVVYDDTEGIGTFVPTGEPAFRRAALTTTSSRCERPGRTSRRSSIGRARVRPGARLSPGLSVPRPGVLA
jgi:hypothetical protein